MSLDINTPKGQKSLADENKMLNYIKDYWGVDIITTNKEIDAVCDGFLIKNNTIIALFESKCRDLTLEKLEEYGSWLVTYDKITKCKLLSKYLKVPFIGFLYLTQDNIIMHWNITDNNGNYNFEFNHEITETQKTINGGTINRDNAFLPISEGKFVQNRKLKTK